MRTPKPIQIHTLLNRLVALSQQSCKVIRAAHFNGKVSSFDKNAAESSLSIPSKRGSQIGFESVVTDVDLKCQHLISTNLKAMYPNARQVGEEDLMLKKAKVQQQLQLGSSSLLKTMVQADAQRYFDKK